MGFTRREVVYTVKRFSIHIIWEAHENFPCVNRD